jgi:hypothetical protein
MEILDEGTHFFDPGAVSGKPGQASLFRPSAITIRHNSNMDR